MGTKQVVVEPNPKYMGCKTVLSRNNAEELKKKLDDRGKPTFEDQLCNDLP